MNQARTRLAPGTQVGPYRIIELLGKGGMGSVYRAQQMSLEREVALKILHTRMDGTDPKQARQHDCFIAEARTAAQLQHPALLAVHDIGIDPESHLMYFSMECIEGANLRELVQRDGPLSVDQARTIIRSAAAGVGYAHSHNIVHRDIKPDNILLNEHGEVKVADLGLATTVDKSGGAKARRRRLMLIGTVGWSAPEQLRNPSLSVAASDIFSLGCVYYFLRTGEDPFDGDGLIDFAVKLHTEAPPLLDQLAPADHMLLETMLAVDPEDRPQDGNAAASYIESLPYYEESGDSRRRRTVGGGKRRRRRR